MIYFGGIALLVVGYVIGFVIGKDRGEVKQREDLDSQFYSLYFFLDGEARKTVEIIHQHLSRLGFIDDAHIRELIRQYRKNQKQNGKEI